MSNVTHFIQIGLDDVNHLGITGRVLFRLHGFLASRPEATLAVDFPDWQKPTTFMAAGLGKTIRLLGAKEHLAEFLSKTGLIQFLIEGGIVVSGIKPIPEVATQFVQVQRSYTVDRLGELLKNPKQIKYDENEAVDDRFKELAVQQDTSPGLLAKIDYLMNKLHQEKRKSASVRVQSESSGRPFIMNIKRDIVIESAGAGKYSTYGLSVDGACIPTW